jgi:hypothetical protein
MDSKSLGRVVYGSDAHEINHTPSTTRQFLAPRPLGPPGLVRIDSKNGERTSLEFAASEPRPAPLTG